MPQTIERPADIVTAPVEAGRLITTEELLAMPDGGVDLELIRGQIRVVDVTRRNPSHSFVEANTAGIFWAWIKTQPEPRGRVYCGEIGFRIRRDPDTTVGIDVAYIDAAMVANIPRKAGLIEGSPILAVEILSPSDKQEDILAKVQEYLESGTKIVLLLEPVFETVTVFRPDAQPMLLAGKQELNVEPHLPGFRCEVSEFFRG